jgi:hypothetical protein
MYRDGCYTNGMLDESGSEGGRRAYGLVPTVESPKRRRGEELGDRIAEHAFHLDAAMHRLLTDVRAFDEGGHWADQGAVSCAAWLSWRVGWTPGTGREHVRVAKALGALPLIDGALREGRLSYSKVRAITRVATPATEAALLNDALHATAAQLETICRKFATVQRLQKLTAEDVAARRMVTRRERGDGMVVIEAVLPADEAAIVYAAIEREAARLSVAEPRSGDVPADPAATSAEDVPAEPAATSAGDVPAEPAATSAGDVPAEMRSEDVPAQLAEEPAGGVPAGTRRLDRAGGLVAMAEAVMRGNAPGRTPVELVVTIGREVLAGDAEGVGCLGDGTCISAETARRLACDCGVVEMREGPGGEPLSVGRKTRTIGAAILRALARRDETCRFPGCTNRRFLDAHHIVHWVNGGETSLVNTCRVCRFHHTYVHEHGYTIEWRGGELVFLDPRGRVVVPEPARDVKRPLGLATIRALAEEDGLAIDEDTGACGWDGRRVDYDWVVDDLARREYRQN